VSETRTTLEQVEESQKKTLGEIIEVLCIQNFPKIDSERILTAAIINFDRFFK